MKWLVLAALPGTSAGMSAIQGWMSRGSHSAAWATMEDVRINLPSRCSGIRVLEKGKFRCAGFSGIAVQGSLSARGSESRAAHLMQESILAISEGFLSNGLGGRWIHRLHAGTAHLGFRGIQIIGNG